MTDPQGLSTAPQNSSRKLPVIPMDSENAGIMVAALLAGFTRNVHSGDVRILSILHAQDLAMENGVPMEIVEAFFGQVNKIMEAGQRKGPLSSMF